MIYISHRGNLDGESTFENDPVYIDTALQSGYDVEIDFWIIENSLFLGHDYPKYSIDVEWLEYRKLNLWIHCKNIQSLEYLKDLNSNFNYFYHQNDDVAITSHGYFWTFPGKKLTKYSIACMPELGKFLDLETCLAICTDYPKKYKTY